ncbi:MAG: YqgE/AlgH family protein [Nitratireductor sp.]|nr:YqgE/AlgH family protein [Nitratireductor sp.]MCB1460469.1 YqgE/AlgH family protein [Nitratireductor sp.]
MHSDMDTLEGQFLIAMPNMGDQRFERTVVYICSHSHEGAMGLVVNRSLEKPGIVEFFEQLNIVTGDETLALPAEIRATQLGVGGPVEPGRGFVLHSPDFQSENTMLIDADVCLTATLEILRAIARGTGPQKAMIALGYAGWGSGQLEEEISSNGWLTSQADSSIIFDPYNDTKYERALRNMGINPLLLSAESGHA